MHVTIVCVPRHALESSSEWRRRCFAQGSCAPEEEPKRPIATAVMFLCLLACFQRAFPSPSPTVNCYPFWVFLTAAGGGSLWVLPAGWRDRRDGMEASVSVVQVSQLFSCVSLLLVWDVVHSNGPGGSFNHDYEHAQDPQEYLGCCLEHVKVNHHGSPDTPTPRLA